MHCFHLPENLSQRVPDMTQVGPKNLIFLDYLDFQGFQEFQDSLDFLGFLDFLDFS